MAFSPAPVGLVRRHERAGIGRRLCAARRPRTGTVLTRMSRDVKSKRGAVNSLVPKVLSIGEALLDVVDDETFPGGAPANLAAAYSRLGATAAFIGPIGSDDAGRKVLTKLNASGVNLDGVKELNGLKTRKVLVKIDDEGEREFVGFDGMNAGFADVFAFDIKDVPERLFFGAEFVVTGTLGLAFPGSREFMQRAMDIAKTCEARRFVDVNWRPIFWDGQVASNDEARNRILEYIREQADFVKVSVDDVSFLFGEDMAAKALCTPQDLLPALDGSVCGVFVTDGPRGVSWCVADKDRKNSFVGTIPAFKPSTGKVVDSTGAGDVFLGAFLAQLISSDSDCDLTDREEVLKCATFGAATATLSLRGLGGIEPLPSRDEVEKFLKAHSASK